MGAGTESVKTQNRKVAQLVGCAPEDLNKRAQWLPKEARTAVLDQASALKNITDANSRGGMEPTSSSSEAVGGGADGWGVEGRGLRGEGGGRSMSVSEWYD